MGGFLVYLEFKKGCGVWVFCLNYVGRDVEVFLVEEFRVKC